MRSSARCSRCRSERQRRPADPVEPFLGTWSGVFTTQDHEYWTFADIQCFVGCPLDFYDQLSALLADPANDVTPAMALAGQSAAAWLAAFDAMLTPLGRQVREANRAGERPEVSRTANRMASSAR